MNVNCFLENGKRTSVSGKNVYVREGFTLPSNRMGGEWLPPKPGLRGELYVGHRTPIIDALVPQFFEGEKELSFSPVRHRWTPAWTKTYYRCEPDKEYYPMSGCISFSESKCFTPEDVFFSTIEISSDKREETEIRVKLNSAFSDKKMSTQYDFFGNKLEIEGFWALKNSVTNENEFMLRLPAKCKVTFSYTFAFAKEETKASELAVATLEKDDPIMEKERVFNDFMKQYVPTLECEDMDVLRMYYYRWYLLYRGIHKPEDVVKDHPVKGDCFYESPYGGLNHPIGLPVPHHLEEARWMRLPEVVYSDAYNWSRELDCYHRWYIEYTPMAIWNVYCNHPNEEFLKKAYPSCKKYAFKDFKPEKKGYEFLPIMYGSWCTGAEYSASFYQHTTEPWDWTEDHEGVNMGLAEECRALYRLDHICYSIGNLLGCAKMAEKLGYKEDKTEMQVLADRSIAALKKYFWSTDRGCFASIDAKTGKQCDQGICYESFYPFLWDMVGKEYFKGFTLLFDQDGFAGDFSITTVEKHCPMYWFDNCIAGPTKSSMKEPHYYGCSWNGPVWPYATSGVLDALGGAAMTDKSLQKEWMRMFEGYNEVQFMGGDRSTPMVVEHYRPTDGVAFSSTCDYFHSKWIDLFMKYWAGISLENGEVVFKPFAECEFTLRDVQLGEKNFNFEQKLENGMWKRYVTQKI